MNFSAIAEFERELKNLSKKYRSLPDDLEGFKKVLTKFPQGTGKHFALIHNEEKVKIMKARLFCRYLRGSSLRVIYAYHTETDTIEFIRFIELYFKGHKEREDQNRINLYLKYLHTRIL